MHTGGRARNCPSKAEGSGRSDITGSENEPVVSWVCLKFGVPLRIAWRRARYKVRDLQCSTNAKKWLRGGRWSVSVWHSGWASVTVRRSRVYEHVGWHSYRQALCPISHSPLFRPSLSSTTLLTTHVRATIFVDSPQLLSGLPAVCLNVGYYLMWTPSPTIPMASTIILTRAIGINKLLQLSLSYILLINQDLQYLYRRYQRRDGRKLRETFKGKMPRRKCPSNRIAYCR